jgi:hypothetical protein
MRGARGAIGAGLLAGLCVLLNACGQAPGSGELPAKDVATGAAAASAAPTGSSAAAGATAAAASPTAAETAATAATAAPVGSGVDAPNTAGPGVKAAAPAGSAAAAPTATAAASAAPTAVASAAPTATAEAAPALTVQSAALQEPAFSVWMSSAKSYKVGQTGYVEAVVVPKGNYHCNESYPYKVKLGAAPAGVSYPEAIVRGASVTATRTSIRVPFTATAAGDARISGKVHFSVCNPEQCVIDARDVAATVKIE